MSPLLFFEGYNLGTFTSAQMKRHTTVTNDVANDPSMMTIGGATKAAAMASPLAAAKVPQKMALISDPSCRVR